MPLQAEPLVDGASVRAVQWYVDNLLPEENQRLLLAGDAGLDAADASSLLNLKNAVRPSELACSPILAWHWGDIRYSPDG